MEYEERTPKKIKKGKSKNETEAGMKIAD